MISKASSQLMDDTEYVPVSSIFIPELIYASSNAQVILSGIIPRSCLTLNRDEIELKQYGNVYVIIPKARILRSAVCKPAEIPLQSIVSLGEVKKTGSYLIHVRSQSGLSVNKVFHVKDREWDIQGY